LATHTQKVSLPNMKILYIEDSYSFFKVVQIQLEECENNYELIHAGNLKDGLKILRDESIDLTLLDLKLPDSEGIQTIDWIVRHDPSINFIVLTGSDDKSIGLYAKDKGAKDFLIKDDICNSPKILEESIIYSIDQHKSFQGIYDRQIEYLNRQEKYHYAFNDNRYPILIINIAKRKLVDINCATRNLLGYSEKDIIPNEVKNIFHSEDDLDSIIENINYKGELSKSINIKGRNNELISARVSIRLTCIKKDFCIHITIIDSNTSPECNYVSMKETVIKFLAADKLKRAINYLIKNLGEKNYLQSELINISGRLAALSKDNIKGTVSHEEIKRERNNIRYSLVDIIGSLSG